MLKRLEDSAASRCCRFRGQPDARPCARAYQERVRELDSGPAPEKHDDKAPHDEKAHASRGDGRCSRARARGLGVCRPRGFRTINRSGVARADAIADARDRHFRERDGDRRSRPAPLKAALPESLHTVLFAGFQAAGTRGRQLVDGHLSVKIHGQLIPVRAHVALIESMSAHADSNEILRWLGGFSKPPLRTFLVHGEPASMESLTAAIRAKLGWATASREPRGKPSICHPGLELTGLIGEHSGYASAKFSVDGGGNGGVFNLGMSCGGSSNTPLTDSARSAPSVAGGLPFCPCRPQVSARAVGGTKRPSCSCMRTASRRCRSIRKRSSGTSTRRRSRTRHLLRPAVRPQPRHAPACRGDHHRTPPAWTGDACGNPALYEAVLVEHSPYNNLTARKFVMKARRKPLRWPRMPRRHRARRFRCARGIRSTACRADGADLLQPGGGSDRHEQGRRPGQGHPALEREQPHVNVSRRTSRGSRTLSLNSRLAKRDGALVEEVYRVGGRYDAEIGASSPTSRRRFRLRPRRWGKHSARSSTSTGGRDADRVGLRLAWVQDKNSPVDTMNGFIGST